MSEQARCECGHAESEHAGNLRRTDDLLGSLCLVGDCGCSEFSTPTNTDTTIEAATCEECGSTVMPAPNCPTPKSCAAIARTTTEAATPAIEASTHAESCPACDDDGGLCTLCRTYPTPSEDLTHAIADVIQAECFTSADDDSRCERAAARIVRLVAAPTAPTSATPEQPTLSTTALEEIRERHEADKNGYGYLPDAIADCGKLLTHIATLQHQLNRLAGNRETGESGKQKPSPYHCHCGHPVHEGRCNVITTFVGAAPPRRCQCESSPQPTMGTLTPYADTCLPDDGVTLD